MTRVISTHIVDFTVSGGIQWLMGAAELASYNSQGRVVFEALSSRYTLGFLAIDDISVDNRLNCPVHGK